MDKAQVIKVKYNGSMCRITAASIKSGVLSYVSLEERIRATFKLHPKDAITCTYTDSDGDVINLSSDEDIMDALQYQQLNPLRIDLTVAKADGATVTPGLTPSASMSSASSSVLDAAAADAAVKSQAAPQEASAASPTAPAGGDATAVEAVKNLTEMVEKQLRELLAPGDVEKLVKDCEPLLKAAPAKIAEVLSAALNSGLSVSFEPVLEQGSSWTAARPLVFPPPDVAAAAAAATEAAQAAVTAGAAAAAAAAKAGAEAAAAAAASTPAAATPAPALKAAEQTGTGSSSTDNASAARPVVHRGIVCDGCDMNPIVGVRYKSLVKHDYDLCEKCMRVQKQNPGDYRSITQPVYRPAMYRHGQSFVQCQPGGQWGGRMCAPVPMGRGPVCRPGPGLKLEARFVADVTIPDNMELLPGTRFTKIWRMRNTGTLPWPQYTQIVHIGGDALGERSASLLEIPTNGVPPDAEVDVSVDMVAPEQMGRYMSHWRLCAPGGPKFGHRVWALVQVVKPEPSTVARTFVRSSPRNISAPAPPAEEVLFAGHAEIVEPKAEAEAPSVPTTSAAPSAPPAVPVEEREDPIIALVRAASRPEGAPSPFEEVNSAPAVAVEAAIPAPEEAASAPAPAPASAAAEGAFLEVPVKVAEAALPAESPSAPPAPVENSTVGNFALVDMPKESPLPAKAESDTASVDGFVDAGVAPPEGSAPNGKAMAAAEPVAVEQPVSLAAGKAKAAAEAAREQMFDIEDEAEAEALDQLEGMGFEDREFNKEVLAKAGGSVVNAIDVLMGAAEWDPMLAELEEMGFEDKLLNKRMMFKNDGNVKGALKDLVRFYKN